MELIGNEFYEKNESNFKCVVCDFKCSFMSDWKRHISTRKHLVSVDRNKMELNGTKKNENYEKNEKNNINMCEYCKKKYKSSSGL